MLALLRKGELCRTHLLCQKNVRGREAMRWGEKKIVRTWEMEGVQGRENEDKNITYCEILKKREQWRACAKRNESERKKWRSQE